jgi:hypothetical protein
MKYFSTLIAIACIGLGASASFGRTITDFHLAPASATTLVSTPAPNNDNTVNASPNTITLPAGGSSAAPFVAATLTPIDFIFNMETSGGTTEYRATTFVANNSGTPWTGFIFQLGTGSGANFKTTGITVPEIIPPTFDSPNFDPDLTNTAFSTVALNAYQITFTGGPLPSGPASVMTSSFSIDTYDDQSAGNTNFTLRMIPVPEPSAMLLATFSALAVLKLRKRL